MNPLELFDAAGVSANMYCCGACRKHFFWTVESAEACCQPKPPRLCKYCEQPLTEGDWKTTHPACLTAERYRTADTIEDLGEGVWYETYGPQDGYFENMDELVRWLLERKFDDPEAGWPGYVWATKSQQLRRIDVADISEWMCEEAYEDAADRLEGTEELQVALNAFWELNAGILSYTLDYTRKIFVPDQEEYETADAA